MLKCRYIIYLNFKISTSKSKPIRNNITSCTRNNSKTAKRIFKI